MPFFIPDDYPFFPHPLLADEDGFLAMCDDLSTDRLILAYHFGIFPWYIEGQPMWWFYTHPRCVLKPEDVKISKSMRPYINQNKYGVSFDQCFEEVINNCQQISRKGQDSTWITPKLKESFIQLHELGYAHSVEVWEEEQLVGGLYGIAIGKIFFGESMFAHKPNASKFGLISLCKFLQEKGYELIDCQQVTPHIVSLGATTLSKESFFDVIKQNLLHETALSKWNNISNDKFL